ALEPLAALQGRARAGPMTLGLRVAPPAWPRLSSPSGGTSFAMTPGARHAVRAARERVRFAMTMSSAYESSKVEFNAEVGLRGASANKVEAGPAEGLSLGRASALPGRTACGMKIRTGVKSGRNAIPK